MRQDTSDEPKKLLIVYILEILKRYTDEEHTLTHKEISDLLLRDYNMAADRKSIRRNLTILMDAGFDISCDTIGEDSPEAPRSQQNTNFRYDHDITDSELRLLIDSLLFSKNIPAKKKNDLIKKLEGLSSVYFKSRVKHITTVPATAKKNEELFYNIDIIDEAIAKRKQLSFNYLEYHTDGKLHPRITRNGKTRRFTVNPYYIAATNGRYYLICNNDWFDSVTHFRIDRITNLKLLETPAKPESEVKGLEKGFSLSKHMAEHIYMYSDESVRVMFRMNKKLLSELFDWFSGDLTFTAETEDEVTVSVLASPLSMELWAVQFSGDVTILSPESLKAKVIEDLEEALKRYKADK